MSLLQIYIGFERDPNVRLKCLMESQILIGEVNQKVMCDQKKLESICTKNFHICLQVIHLMFALCVQDSDNEFLQLPSDIQFFSSSIILFFVLRRFLFFFAFSIFLFPFIFLRLHLIFHLLNYDRLILSEP